MENLYSKYNDIKINNGKINFGDIKEDISLDASIKISFEDNKKKLP